ncbi:MAG: hypothetical protein A2283_11290 [Lentisphaerae bacterium RIFOXYA12_FULL_48_11]|nr:MAG: hypothetical protein A2283_11290 [Lentisphaerae bacterium RIFOXYA12_FULL_48_11]
MRLFGLTVLAVVVSSAVMAADKNPVGKPYVYKKAGERELKLYVVTPDDHKATDKRPAMVFFHGGGFVGGSPSQFNEQAKYLASRGMVVALVEYRFVSKKKAMELPIVCVQDAKSAMRWVRSHAGELGIDPGKIAAGGGSAGGHLAAAAGLIDGQDDPQDDLKVSSRPCALALFNPALDLTQFSKTGGPFAEQAKVLSPLYAASQDDPPAIVFFGSDDSLGKCVNDFKERMEKAGVRCEVRIYEGQKHGFFNYGRNDNKYYTETLLELDKFLASTGLLSGLPTIKN